MDEPPASSEVVALSEAIGLGRGGSSSKGKGWGGKRNRFVIQVVGGKFGVIQCLPNVFLESKLIPKSMIVW